MTFELSQPNKRGRKLDEGKITRRQLVVPGKDAPIVFNFVDEAFDQMPFLIEVGVVRSLLNPTFTRRNDRNCFMVDDKGENNISIVAAVSNHVVPDTASQQGFGLRDIMSLTACQQDA